MKHTLRVTIILVVLFLLAHFVGLYITQVFLPKDLPLGIERPEVEESTSYIPIIIGILIATSLALILIKFRARKAWKLWFFIAVFYTLGISFSAFVPEIVALVFAGVFALLRIFKPNPIIQNFTEVFIYGAIAAIFVPILNVFSIFVLLVIISVYDYIAVRKSKHMVSMANFSTESQIFAGLMVPYGKNNLGILGGGDIGFTLLFSGVVLKTFGMVSAIISSFIISLSLLYLFLVSEKGKFYPAMPYLTVGCLIAYLVVLFL